MIFVFSFFYTNHINQQYLHADEEIAYTRFVCLNLTKTEPMRAAASDERMKRRAELCWLICVVQVDSVQSQMKSKGGYVNGTAESVQG